MKKSNSFAKKLLVIGLAVVLLAVCVSSSTFSWFDRPQTKSGGSLSLAVPYGDKDPDGNSLTMKAYDGYNVTMQTYLSEDDGLSFKEEAAAPAESGTLAPSKRVYYRTVLTNKNTDAQNVSLYIRNFNPGSTGVVCVGVNRPIKAFKNYSYYSNPKASAVKSAASGPGTKRIYFETSSDKTNWNYANSFQVCYGSSLDQWKTLTKCPSRDYMYYTDLPADTNQLYFTAGKSANNTDWGGDSYRRSQTFTNLTGDGLSKTKSLLFKHSGSYDSTGYNNAQLTVEQTDGLYVTEYYKTASLAVGDSIDLSLAKGSQYGGSSISYKSSDTSVATIDGNGKLTAKSKAGTTVVTYTITSQHSESVSYTCKVTVKSYSASAKLFPNAPIVTNLLIPGTSANAKEDDHNNVQEVYWFIQNGDEMYGTATAAANYSLSGIYLGL